MNLKRLFLCFIAMVMVDQFNCASLPTPSENTEEKSDVQTYVIEPSSNNEQIDDALTSTDIPSIGVGEDLQNLSPSTDVSVISPSYLCFSTISDCFNRSFRYSGHGNNEKFCLSYFP